jgi:hypothetical protein
MMEIVAKQLAWAGRKMVDLDFNGKTVAGAYVDLVKTRDVLDAISANLPATRQIAESEYAWTCHHNGLHLKFLTSDNPCYYDPKGGDVFLPLALDLGLSGKLLAKGERPCFKHDDATHVAVRSLNRLTVQNARSFVYAHAASERVLELIGRHYIQRYNDPPHSGRSWKSDAMKGVCCQD